MIKLLHKPSLGCHQATRDIRGRQNTAWLMCRLDAEDAPFRRAILCCSAGLAPENEPSAFTAFDCLYLGFNAESGLDRSYAARRLLLRPCQVTMGLKVSSRDARAIVRLAG